MEVKNSKINLSFKKRVLIKTPYYGEEEEILKKIKTGTSGLIAKKIIVVDHEPIAGELIGQTHRWWYDTKKTWTFCKYSPISDNRMLRSMPEMIELLLNPERKVSTIDEHVCRLKMALYENVWNKHCVNKMYYWLYDAILMYIYKLDRFILESPIFIRDRELDNSMKPGNRVWFRKIEGYLDLEV